MRIERDIGVIRIFDADGYEEIKMPQWQTLEEFNVEGWCWITLNGDVDMAYYAGGLFYYDDACDKTVYDTWPESTITNVQHIPKPEAPK